MKILLLLGDGDPHLKDLQLSDVSVKVHDIYTTAISRLAIRVLRKNRLTSYMTLGRWKWNIKEYDTIVCFSGDLPIETLIFLAKYAKDKKIIYYLYGRVNDNVPEDKVKKWLEKIKKIPNNVEVWSYDLNDCKNYGFFYNKSFYTTGTAEFFKENLDKAPVYDVTLIANNKGREDIIKSLHKKLSNYGLELFFYVLNIDNFEKNKCTDNCPMAYMEYLEIVKNSRAILDLVNEGNYGLTLRPIEALLAKKKLITNYKDIKNMDFYNAQNIFILGEHNEAEMKMFLELPYVEPKKDIIESYSECAWIKRFVKK